MAATYSLVLRACPEESREAVALVLGKAFSLKEKTCDSIAASTPIVLLTELKKEEAAALSLALIPLQQPKGTKLEFTTGNVEDLPKIDWPKRPLIFKQDIADHVAACEINLPCPGCRKTYHLLNLLAARLDLDTVKPSTQPGTEEVTIKKPGEKGREFKGAHLPEITPFFNQALPPVSGAAPPPPTTEPAAEGDAESRLNEMFPDDNGGGGLAANNEDINSILNRLLPDEEQMADDGAPAVAPAPANVPSGPQIAAGGAGAGYSVFLAKITDEARRAKVMSLLMELAQISNEEADQLSKKVIIPVLRGASKEEAESAKLRFAKIGILARVKGPES
jgi:hypothetical protein